MNTDQISLPGQAHVAPGPHDQTGMYVFHHALRRDLGRFESAVRRTPVADQQAWHALARRWTRFGEVLHHHHGIEDEAFWPAMLRRLDEAGDAEGRALLTAMEDEHGLIDPALAACGEAFATMAGHPCRDHREALEARVVDARRMLLEHLAHEETDALPLLQRVMTVEDHAAAEAAAQAGYPPRLLPFLLPWATEGVPAPVVDRLLGGSRALGLVLRACRGRYERQERRAFGHA